MVPARLVERVDVLTSGASAVYGSDAVAGVVNFITKRDFQGFEIDLPVRLERESKLKRIYVRCSLAEWH